MRKGHVEKLVIPSRAKFQSFQKLNFVEPNALDGRSYGTPMDEYPGHANNPFMNRFRSGRSLRASMTRRLIRRKSPTSCGMLICDDRVESVEAQAHQVIRGVVVNTDAALAPAKANPKDQSITETLKKPEAWASIGGLLSGLGGMASGTGPMQWALAIIMVGAFAAGAYFLIKRMQDQAA
ncbi:hypothetical protein [Pseudochrobactrum saccharolyticum]|uniref:hypothetical protein n=1 Tax=Pseudochrobactrum saccharolyticum TaxID=354352 RepID=UPI002765BC4D|nr:hypothetical protein [Pseudochrobactrum saccharolyticum]MDP8249293.1 hypothetical protein [Pseudochrobactrum saccharolyticum]